MLKNDVKATYRAGKTYKLMLARYPSLSLLAEILINSDISDREFELSIVNVERLMEKQA